MAGPESGWTVTAGERAELDRLLAGFGQAEAIRISDAGQGWGELMIGHGFGHDGLTLGGRRYDNGLGGHAPSRIELRTQQPIRRIAGIAGIEENPDTRQPREQYAQLRFQIESETGAVLAQSPVLSMPTTSHWRFEVEPPADCRVLYLTAATDRLAMAHAAWADLRVELADGSVQIPGVPERLTFARFPVSFRYGTTDAATWLAAQPVEIRRRAENVVYQIGVPGTALVIFATVTRRDDGAVQWRWRLENQSTVRSAPLRDFRVLDWRLVGRGGWELYRATGSYALPMAGPEAFAQAYELEMRRLLPGEPVRFGADGGRPSSRWMPYWNLFDPERRRGMAVAVGWAGQWVAEFEARPQDCRIAVGLECLDAVLEPGEVLELPEILFVMYEGESAWRGFNRLRRQWTPVRRLPLSNMHWGGLSEAEHFERLDFLARHRPDLPFEVYWIDAGWFGPATPVGAATDEAGGGWARATGDWRCNPTLYPHGLEAIAHRVHELGMKLLLWMEPERAAPGTPVRLAHPEWFPGAGPEDNALFDLGQPAAWRFVLEQLAAAVERWHIDILRIDFNIEPLSYWLADEAPGRRGIREIRYVNGLYALWEELTRRFPALELDNCSSGGRRLDYRLNAWSFPLWASDSQCHENVVPELLLRQSVGLAHWVPAAAFGSQNPEGGDTFAFRCAAAAGRTVHLFSTANHPVDAVYPVAWLARQLAEWQELRDFYAGDFYLAAAGRNAGWVVRQFDRPDVGGGVLEYIRPPGSPYCSGVFALAGLEAAAMYEWLTSSGERRVYSGAKLMAGVALTLPLPRQAQWARYRKLDAPDNHNRSHS